MDGERDNLDQAIRDLYRDERLPAERMQAIVAQIAMEQRPARLKYRAWIGAIAAMLLVCTSLVVWMHPQRLTSREVAEDVQRHHVKPFVADVTAGDFSSLSAKMTTLDFTPILPDRLKDKPLEIVGARYCSVGHTHGAQVRLRDSAGMFQTLCEFRAADVDEISDGQFRIEGLDVSIWHENGLVVAMTAPGP